MEIYKNKMTVLNLLHQIESFKLKKPLLLVSEAETSKNTVT